MITPKTKFEGTKHIYACKFVQMTHPNIGERNQPFAVRLANYMNKYHISRKTFVELCDEYRGKYGASVTEQDLSNYLYNGNTPKIDKLMTISRVMGVPMEYFCGYGQKRVPKPKNQLVMAHFRKNRAA